MLDLTKYKDIRSSTIWTTRDGERMPVKRMKESHIKNTIVLLVMKQKVADEQSLGELEMFNRPLKDWVEIFKTELKFRVDPKSIFPVEEPVIADSSYDVTKEEEILL